MRRRSKREEEKKQRTTTTKVGRKQGNAKGRKEEGKKMHNKSVMSAELTYNFTEIGQTENKNRNK